MKDRLCDQLHPVTDEEDVALESLAEMLRDYWMESTLLWTAANRSG